MITKKEIIKDLEYICKQTDSRVLFYDDIHTSSYQKDAELFIKEMERLGYSKETLFNADYIRSVYGLGVMINHQGEEADGGYMLCSTNSEKNLLVLPGLNSISEKHAVYHEAAHAYQNKDKLFKQNVSNKYNDYLEEIHAETFASMVMLLKAKNVLEYKKLKLYRMAIELKFINDCDITSEELYYVSLPVELGLIKEIRRQGRKNVQKRFDDNGTLNFQAIAQYTRKIVKKYAYSKAEFEQIRKGKPTRRYKNLERQAKAFRILEKAALLRERIKIELKILKHKRITYQRDARINKLMKWTPKDKKERLIKGIYDLDGINIHLSQDLNVFSFFESVEDKNKPLSVSRKDCRSTLEKLHIVHLLDAGRSIYDQYKDEPYFQKLFNKIKTIDGRYEAASIISSALNGEKTYVNSDSKTR